jgi:hypothetical protein
MRRIVYAEFGLYDFGRSFANFWYPPSDRRAIVEFIEGPVKTKIENINYGVKDRRFDILINASDDMWPLVAGYDDIIAQAMQRYFAALEGALHFWDGHSSIYTLSIMGFWLYRHFGYIYHPAYASLYCDNEFQEVCQRMGKLAVPEGWGPGQKVLIEHRHPMFTHEPYDALMKHTESFYAQDGKTFAERKARNFDIHPFEDGVECIR